MRAREGKGKERGAGGIVLLALDYLLACLLACLLAYMLFSLARLFKSHCRQKDRKREGGEKEKDRRETHEEG